MINETLAKLLSRKLAGEATPEELTELEKWIKDHPEDGYFIDLMHAYWQPTATPFLSDNKAEDLFNKIVETDSVVFEEASWFRRYRKPLLAAASVLFFSLLSWLYFSLEKPGTIHQHEVTTHRGVRSSILLPDGSRVWLNSESRIVYDSLFDGHTREVTLIGEAFFDVVKDAQRPFIVHAGEYAIKVLGTAFNVKSYALDSVMETTLIRGKVEVSGKNGAPSVLFPNQKLVLPRQTIVKEEIKQEPVILSISYPSNKEEELPETAWVHNRLVFDEINFAELATKLERWFDVKITFEDQSVARYRLSGSFEDENIQEVLDALNEIITFNYTIKDKYVIIKK